VNVHITFDVEVWCGGWDDLDARFPAAFERYCYGRSAAGEYALPKTLETLRRHGLRGVFFVEPLFAARFGQTWLARIVDLLLESGQDVQLHLHPEWTDEITPPPIANAATKRQHLTHYDVDEQTALVGFGRRLLESAKGAPITAFRAGSFAANRDTYRALRANGITTDSSLNACYDYTEGTIDGVHDFTSHRVIDGVQVYPVTVLRDGFGRARAAQLNGCTFGELRAALVAAERAGVRHFVIVSHNFEMLRADTSDPDWAVVRRFEALCAFLAANPERFKVGALPTEAPAETALGSEARPAVGPWLTAGRYVEQARRMLG
jgi:peptidoglycan/xylan/chitin deacetylase (PgdA/CDA1 family)